MTIDKDNLLDSIMASLDRIQYIKLEDIPNIDMYMDQVTTFMERKLRKTTRHQGEDKVLTKTMINNYAKNKLLPPPEQKKYSRDHIICLIFIYYYKGFLSMGDIQTLLEPLKDKHFASDSSLDLGSIYQEILALEKRQVEAIKQDIADKYEQSQATFENAEGKEAEFLHLFSFISLLGFDVYVKRLLIEKLIDSLNSEKE
jgi:DNA-binding transcriptional MerR regulator